jgi:hypothetical protein
MDGGLVRGNGLARRAGPALLRPRRPGAGRHRRSGWLGLAVDAKHPNSSSARRPDKEVAVIAPPIRCRRPTRKATSVDGIVPPRTITVTAAAAPTTMAPSRSVLMRRAEVAPATGTVSTMSPAVAHHGRSTALVSNDTSVNCRTARTDAMTTARLTPGRPTAIDVPRTSSAARAGAPRRRIRLRNRGQGCTVQVVAENENRVEGVSPAASGAACGFRQLQGTVPGGQRLSRRPQKMSSAKGRVGARPCSTYHSCPRTARNSGPGSLSRMASVRRPVSALAWLVWAAMAARL